MTNVRVSKLIAALVVCVAALGFLAFIAPKHTTADTVIGGYAWSETIGWISLSGTGYGLSYDASGNLSGYAWSENIGWISAQAADVAGCPAGTCTPKLTGTTFTGWLKAIAANGNGWDGWISLSCANTGTCGTSNYGVVNTGGVYSGYAWGSDVVGWIDFQYAVPPAPTCSLSPTAQTIVRGANANLSWTSTSATTGSTSPGAIAMVPASGGNFSVNPNATTTYTAGFMGAGGYGSCQAVVNVQCAPIYSCSGQTIQYTNGGCVTTNVTTCVAPASCVPGQPTCFVPPPSFTAGGTLTGHLQAKPQVVRTASSTVLYWNVTNVQSCTVTGNGDSWSSASSSLSSCTKRNGGCVSSPINSSATYTLSCTALVGSGSPNITETVTVTPSPTYQEI
jgi:hypothetical protein